MIIKRTTEMVLGIIGLVFYGLIAIYGIFLISLQNNTSLKNALISGASKSPSNSPVNMSKMIETAAQSGWMIFIGTGLAFILGLMAVVYIKGNKKPKASGILFLVGAAIALVLTKGGGFIPDILYIIAGIMALVRKPPVAKDTYQEKTY